MKPPRPDESDQHERRAADRKCADRVDRAALRKGGDEGSRGSGPGKVTPSKYEKCAAMSAPTVANSSVRRDRAVASDASARHWRVRYQNESDEPKRHQVRRVVRDVDAVGPERGVDDPPPSSHQEGQLNGSGKRVKVPWSARTAQGAAASDAAAWEYEKVRVGEPRYSLHVPRAGHPHVRAGVVDRGLSGTTNRPPSCQFVWPRTASVATRSDGRDQHDDASRPPAREADTRSSRNRPQIGTRVAATRLATTMQVRAAPAATAQRAQCCDTGRRLLEKQKRCREIGNDGAVHIVPAHGGDDLWIPCHEKRDDEGRRAVDSCRHQAIDGREQEVEESEMKDVVGNERREDLMSRVARQQPREARGVIAVGPRQSGGRAGSERTRCTPRSRSRHWYWD